MRVSEFPDTRWTMVLLAGQQDSPAADDALAHLCRTYWYPLYAFARRRGHAVEEGEDLTQEFFAYLLEKRRIAVADAAKGRFRSFLLTAFKHFISDAADRRDATKRGGGVSAVPLNVEEAEQKLAHGRSQRYGGAAVRARVGAHPDLSSRHRIARRLRARRTR